MAGETVTEDEPEWQPIEEGDKVLGSPPEVAVVALERGVVRPRLLAQPEVVALDTSNRTTMIPAFRIDLTERRSSTSSRRGSAVDAIVVAMAGPAGTVLSGDVGDLRALATYAQDVEVHRV